jgi:hypothetical protein
MCIGYAAIIISAAMLPALPAGAQQDPCAGLERLAQDAGESWFKWAGVVLDAATKTYSAEKDFHNASTGSVASSAPLTSAQAQPQASGAKPPQPGPSMSVASGEELQIGTAWAREKNCKPLPTTITITRKPANGQVSVVDASVTAARQLVGSGSNNCPAGQQIAGKKIIYRSNAGFHGVDTVSYDAQSRAGRFSKTVTITVR